MRLRFLAALPEIRRILRFAGPLMLSQLALIGMGVTDVIVSGHAGTDDLAAVTLGFYLWDIALLVVFGIILANSALVGHHHGAGDVAAVRRQFQQCVWLAVPLSLVSGLAMWGAMHVVAMLNTSPAVAAIAADYLLPMIGTAMLVPFGVAFRSTCEGLGLPRPVMWLNLAALALNAPLCMIFAFGYFGLPALGGAGCGWATLIAFGLLLLGWIVYLLRSPTLAPYRLLHDFEPPRRADLATLLALGMPIGLALLGVGGFFAIIPLLLAPLGAVALAGHSVAMTVDMLMLTVPLGIGQAMSVRVSHELGAGNPAQARAVSWIGVSLLIAIAVVQAAMLVLLRVPISRLFSADPVVVDLAATLLLFAAAYRVFDSLQIGAEMTLRGYKDTRFASALHLGAYWVFGLPLATALGLGTPYSPAFGVKGFWTGMVVTIALASLLMGWRLLHTSHRHLGLRPPRDEAGA